MHMADALLSPTTGLVMWALSAAALGLASRRVRASADDRLVPLMGMLGAFVFAAQMINFSIPGTGSSGHLGGGLLLALLLGPYPALIVISSVLTVQALFFADGGLLALGANIFNLGVLPCLLAYPLLYRPLAGAEPTPRRMALAAFVTALLGLQLGALAVVLQTWSSGISALPLQAFLWLMLPIHAAIGVGEGLATAALLLFVRRHRPDLLAQPPAPAPTRRQAPLRRMLLALGLATLCTGGAGAWFASSAPDGLEWSIARASGGDEPSAPPQGLHAALARAQQLTAWMPDYALPASAQPVDATAIEVSASWPAVDAGTSLAGVLGGGVTLGLLLALGWLLRSRRCARD